MADDRDESRGFTVSDKRRFSPEGGEAHARSEAEGDESLPQGEAPAQSADPESYATREQSALPEITLSMFIMSLSTQALMHMGEIPQPGDDAVTRDMSAGKQVIDILAMLKEKTKGNLQENEEALFDNVLYDLRMRYVELSKSSLRP